MSECIFCNIIAGKIPAEKIYEDERFVAFRDIRPLYRVHLLIVPKEHLASVNEVGETACGSLDGIWLVARKVAERAGVAETGYRLAVNTGRDAGQVVMHFHMHLLAGETLRPL